MKLASDRECGSGGTFGGDIFVAIPHHFSPAEPVIFTFFYLLRVIMRMTRIATTNNNNYFSFKCAKFIGGPVGPYAFTSSQHHALKRVA